MEGKQLKWDIICTGKETHILGIEKDIKELYGGFGYGKRILTVNQIAQLHADNPDDKNEIRTKVKRINELINNNIILEDGSEYFEFGIDIIDLKSEDVSNDHGKECLKSLIDNKIYSQNSINRATNVYILSEQGYSLLINLMADQKSKLIYKAVIRDYFRMKEVILSKEDTQQYMMRILGKKERKKMTDAIKYYIDRGDLVPTSYYNPYAVETNFIYKILFGMTKAQIVDFLGIEFKNKNDTLRNYLCYEDVSDIMNIESRISYMQEDGKSYDEIKNRLEQLYPDVRVPKLAGKDATFIKMLLEG